jgi:hypothetical protein
MRLKPKKHPSHNKAKADASVLPTRVENSAIKHPSLGPVPPKEGIRLAAITIGMKTRKITNESSKSRLLASRKYTSMKTSWVAIDINNIKELFFGWFLKLLKTLYALLAVLPSFIFSSAFKRNLNLEANFEFKAKNIKKIAITKIE